MTLLLGLSVAADAERLIILGVGDSITSGQGSSSGHNSFGSRAVMLLDQSGLSASYVGDGFSGKPSRYFLRIGITDVRRLRPRIVTIQCGSANGDWESKVKVFHAFAAAIGLAVIVHYGGGVAILTTATPSYYGQGGGRATWEVNRRLSNTLVRAAASFFRVLDVDAIWGTGADPNSFKPAFDSGDHTHPSDRGYQAAAVALAQIVRDALAR